MEGKAEEDVYRYAKVFKERYKELNGACIAASFCVLLFLMSSKSDLIQFAFTDYDRIIKNIEKGEARISRKEEIMQAIAKKMSRYQNPWHELKIQYGQNKGKLYNEECDRFMVCFI